MLSSLLSLAAWSPLTLGTVFSTFALLSPLLGFSSLLFSLAPEADARGLDGARLGAGGVGKDAALAAAEAQLNAGGFEAGMGAV